MLRIPLHRQICLQKGKPVFKIKRILKTCTYDRISKEGVGYV